MGKRFALIGAAGFVAPRHMAAIKAVGGDLVAATDPHDSVGVLDSYFPAARFFPDFERFDRYVEKLAAAGTPIDYVVVCSPNYLHDAHCRWAMRAGADAICEKPLVVKPWNVDGLKRIEEQTGRRTWGILQLRHHPAVIGFERPIEPEVEIRYITPRGAWYDASWKGDPAKSGGVQMNIGVHLFDLSLHLFGRMRWLNVLHKSARSVSGSMRLENARVRWHLSINRDELENGNPVREFRVNGAALDLSEGFTRLHDESYSSILSGRGYGIDDCAPAISLVASI